jgi:hypothetical protein
MLALRIRVVEGIVDRILLVPTNALLISFYNRDCVLGSVVDSVHI